MSLSDMGFIFGVLPFFLIAYWIAGRKRRHVVMLLFSLFFYFMNEPMRTPLVIALVLINYVLSVWIVRQNDLKKHNRKKILLWSGIVLDLVVLGVFKWGGIFFAKDISLLAGQSFFTFTMIAYLADVYCKKIKPQKNVIKYINHILMFPKVLMGPIERFSDYNEDAPSLTLNCINEGIKRFIRGFCKKTIIANNLALLVADVNSAWATSSVVSVWIGSIAFSLQLYFDFSGYTDMALGLGRICGYRLSENFNYPCCCSSIRDFWKRWHISLSTWFRDYVYIPLGGSKGTGARTVINLLIVWILTGVWHGDGAEFILWGIIYFVVLVFERFIIKPEQLGGITLLYRLPVLLIINFNWVIFSHGGIRTGVTYCLHMFGYHTTSLANAGDVRLIREYGLYILIALISSTPLISIVREKICKKENGKRIYDFLTPFIILLLFIWGISFELLGGHNPFLYKNF